jgi:hypothetical protein
MPRVPLGVCRPCRGRGHKTDKNASPFDLRFVSAKLFAGATLVAVPPPEGGNVVDRPATDTNPMPLVRNVAASRHCPLPEYAGR